ncbi:hypothetical protein SCAR479_03856 [Seiridium cardinale]|uniref:Uncharacterized protein n=1 Tax=Seiridium cardinale TaxID=138064 RepID=A0ABR2XZZ1_9PEZI
MSGWYFGVYRRRGHLSPRESPRLVVQTDLDDQES